MDFKVIVTISQGRVVWENDQLNVEEGTGRFIKMKPFPYLYKNRLGISSGRDGDKDLIVNDSDEFLEIKSEL